MSVRGQRGAVVERKVRRDEREKEREKERVRQPPCSSTAFASAVCVLRYGGMSGTEIGYGEVGIVGRVALREGMGGAGEGEGAERGAAQQGLHPMRLRVAAE
eukprot:2550697-Rhodomonas_salina.2